MEPQTQTAETSPDALNALDAMGGPSDRAGWAFRSGLAAEEAEEIARAFAQRRGMEGCRKIKTGRGRTIWRVELGGRIYIAKTIRCDGLLGWMRRLLHHTAADREWKRAEELDQCGVDCVRFVAYRREAAAILLSPLIDNATTLTEAWSKSAGSRRRRNALIREVAKAHAALHRAGFVHLDNHPENHLVAWAERPGEGEPRVVLADVGSILRSRSRRRKIESLGQAAHAMNLRASTTDRLRFLTAYVSAHGRTEPGSPSSGGRRIRGSDVRAMAQEVEEAARLHALRLFRQRDRALRHSTGRYFVNMQTGKGAAGAAVTRWSRRVRFADPALPDEPSGDVSRGLSVLLDKLASDAGADERTEPSITLHSWTASSMTEKLMWRLSGSPARRLFEAAHRRRFRDLEHPRVAAFGEYLRGAEYRAVAMVVNV